MAKKYKSEAMATIHETMEGLLEIGAVDKQMMHALPQRSASWPKSQLRVDYIVNLLKSNRQWLEQSQVIGR